MGLVHADFRISVRALKRALEDALNEIEGSPMSKRSSTGRSPCPWEAPMTEPLIRTAVVGAGYSGRNLVRNFLASDEFELDWLCDTDKGAARTLLGRRSPVKVTADVSEILDDPEVEAIVITTPRAPMPRSRSLPSEPASTSSSRSHSRTPRRMRRRSSPKPRSRTTLLVDHTYCYAPPLDRIVSLIEEGHIGEIDYFDSTRINLGLVTPTST